MLNRVIYWLVMYRKCTTVYFHTTFVLNQAKFNYSPWMVFFILFLHLDVDYDVYCYIVVLNYSILSFCFNITIAKYEYHIIVPMEYSVYNHNYNIVLFM